MLSHLLRSGPLKFGGILSRQKQTNIISHPNNLINKRWSGHGMTIEPTDWGWKVLKDSLHFWTVCALVPITVFATIVNLHANPELTEIPEGYEPRHWEYFSHPITRFMAKHVFLPMEAEYEMTLACEAMRSEGRLMKETAEKIEKVMSFYNDYRSSRFRPFFGELYRIARDRAFYMMPHALSDPNEFIDNAYSERMRNIPVEGFKPVD